MGYAIIAVPAGIISVSMVKENNAKKVVEAACLHCKAKPHRADVKFCWNAVRN